LEPQPATPERPDDVKPADAPAAANAPAPGADGVTPQQPGTDSAPAAEEAAAPPAPPLTPVAWLRQNSWFLVLLAVAVGLLVYNWGLDGLWRALLVVVGLGFVIFIHELGHFLAAKWCDVHVLTFSLGFGPPLPGCSVKRGETTYKIGMVPLGGYVQMVGEGSEAEEDENYPRSFKNKPIWQRMLIISAGVVMNVLLGCVCFVIVYQFHGVEVPPATVYYVEAGSPAWKAGVPAGSTFTRIGTTDNPNLEDLKDYFALSGENAAIPVVLTTPGGGTLDMTLTARRDPNDLLPIIGVAAPLKLKLFPEQASKYRDRPAWFALPAADARVVALQPGDVILRATDPDHDGLTELTGGLDELAARMRRLRDRPMTIEVRRRGAAEAEQVDLPAKGFEFGDEVVGTTDPAAADPFVVTKIADDPGDDADIFKYRRRMMRLAGRPALVAVRRKGAGGAESEATLLVPPAYHYGFGLTMKMGEVAGVRVNSEAARAGVKEGDVIEAVRMTWPGDDHPLTLTDTALDPAQTASAGLAVGFGARALPEAPLDPVRLPDDLARKAAAAPKGAAIEVTLTVRRWDTTDKPHAQAPVTLRMGWDRRWADDLEVPISPADPTAVPELGLAYRVESRVVRVAAGSPADKAGLKVNDEIQQIRYKDGKTPAEGKWGYWGDMKSKRPLRGGSEGEVYDEWAHYFYGMQTTLDFPEVQVRVSRNDQLLPNEVTLTAEEDEGWPAVDRGLLFVAETRLQKADNPLQAVGMGAERTIRWIRQIYQQIPLLLSGRISHKLLQGPLQIAKEVFEYAQDPFVLIFFLGMLSVQLAVINFLPIPLLDGGHMVFLVYELVRRRPPSDAVRAVASYVGLAVIGVGMLLLFYQDISRWVFGN
jgi:regulator of sigma E protease